MEGERDCSRLWLKLQHLIFHAPPLCISKISAYVARGCHWNLGMATSCYTQDTLAELMFMVLWHLFWFIVFFELGDVRLKAYVGCLCKENHDQPVHINYSRSYYFLLARTNLKGCGLRSPWQSSCIVSVSKAGFRPEEFCISALLWCNLAHPVGSGCVTSLAGITVKRVWMIKRSLDQLNWKGIWQRSLCRCHSN